LEWLKIFVVTLLAPEWILASAVRQFMNARDVTEQLESARRELKEKPDRPPLEEVREHSDTGSRGEAGNSIMDEGEREVDHIHPKSRAAEEGEVERHVECEWGFCTMLVYLTDLLI
jgi:hypothetical protein